MIKKSILYFLKPIPHYSNFFILNIFGYQFIRTSIIKLAFYLKRLIFIYKYRFRVKYSTKKYANELQEIENNGYICIPNLFSNEDFLKLKELTDKVKDQNLVKYKEKQHNKKLTIYKYLNLNYSQCSEYFDNEMLHNLIRNNSTICDLFFLLNMTEISNKMISYQKIVPINLQNQKHINSLLHCDRFYSFYKFFISINDINSNNAAFRYCKGSHKYNLKKHIFEFFGSIFESFNNLFGRYVPILKFNRYEVDGFLDLKSTSVDTKSNALIIENGSGFHSAGLFKVLGVNRRYIRINPLEVSSHYYLPFALKLKYFLKNKINQK